MEILFVITVTALLVILLIRGIVTVLVAVIFMTYGSFVSGLIAGLVAYGIMTILRGVLIGYILALLKTPTQPK